MPGHRQRRRPLARAPHQDGERGVGTASADNRHRAGATSSRRSTNACQASARSRSSGQTNSPRQEPGRRCRETLAGSRARYRDSQRPAGTRRRCRTDRRTRRERPARRDRGPAAATARLTPRRPTPSRGPVPGSIGTTCSSLDRQAKRACATTCNNSEAESAGVFGCGVALWLAADHVDGNIRDLDLAKATVASVPAPL